MDKNKVYTTLDAYQAGFLTLNGHIPELIQQALIPSPRRAFLKILYTSCRLYLFLEIGYKRLFRGVEKKDINKRLTYIK